MRKNEKPALDDKHAAKAEPRAQRNNERENECKCSTKTPLPPRIIRGGSKKIGLGANISP